MTRGALPALFDDLAFRGEWRPYQRAALEAFERGRAAGGRRTHIVAPPGSGKTLMGVELVRRTGRRALVLAPGSAVQLQWPRAVREFGAPTGTAGPEPSFPIACLTYPSLCGLEDPEAALGRVAAGQRAGVALADLLLSSEARARVDALRAARVGIVVLDECHHLASPWAYLVRAVLAELDDVHVVGLTATPPGDLTGEEVELYGELLGPVDCTVPTPAVVRDGHLAPYLELAWLTEPLDSERAWLAERETRFRELVTALHDDAEGPLSFPAWVTGRVEQRDPALARAGVRFLASAGRAGEAFRRAPDLEDWLVLLEDYALRRLHGDPSPEAADRSAAVAAALGDLGFRLTRRGIRRGTSSEVDRLLTSSGAKALGLVEVLAVERESRGDRLRALVLCDFELAGAGPDRLLGGVLDPAAGSARHALIALGADGRTAPLRPLVVTGRGLRCLPADAEVLLAALAEEARARLSLPDWSAEPDGVLVSLRSTGAEWVPRAWVEVATRVLESGVSATLIGTRALLGEGWYCPAVNCLVDLTAAATGVSVQQMHGRSLRLDPGDPRKLASNWDVVCAAPDLVRGGADYERFTRRHVHVSAPADDGELEAGPSHAHVELGPFGPPPASRFAALDRAMVERAAARAPARERWRIGAPYRGVDLRTLVVRPRPRPALAAADALDAAGPAGAPVAAAKPPPISQRVPLAAGAGVAALAAVAAALTGVAALLAGLLALPASLGWAALRLGRARERLPLVLPLDGAARAVAGAYGDLGELSETAAASLVIEPRASGYVRCMLTEATSEESARFTAALDELLTVADAPRCAVARPLPEPAAGAAALLGRVLLRRPPFPARQHPVPSDLGRAEDRAEAFARAWRRCIGPTPLIRAEAAAVGDGGYETLVRDVWL